MAQVDWMHTLSHQAHSFRMVTETFESSSSIQRIQLSVTATAKSDWGHVILTTSMTLSMDSCLSTDWKTDWRIIQRLCIICKVYGESRFLYFTKKSTSMFILKTRLHIHGCPVKLWHKSCASLNCVKTSQTVLPNQERFDTVAAKQVWAGCGTVTIYLRKAVVAGVNGTVIRLCNGLTRFCGVIEKVSTRFRTHAHKLLLAFSVYWNTFMTCSEMCRRH